MNWLAHIFVSEHSVDYQLGNLLADPLKGRVWPEASEAIRNGFEMHKSIDCFTDQHAVFLRSKQRLGSSGFLRAVVIDVVYDHLLTQSWDQYSVIALDSFINSFHTNAVAAVSSYPKSAQQVVHGIIRSGYLTSYSDLDGLSRALERIDTRLSRKGKVKRLASDYMPLIEASLDDLKHDFSEFFPSLLAHFKSESGINQHHWLKL